MKGKKLCKICHSKISTDQKAVMLMTFIGNKNLEKVYWHFECYTEWLDKSLELRAKEQISNAMRVVLPGVESLVKHVNNNGNIKYNLYSMGTS